MRFPDLFFEVTGDEPSFEVEGLSFSSVVGSAFPLLPLRLDLDGFRGFCFFDSPSFVPRAPFLRASESESSEVTDESDKNNLFASF